MDMEMKALCNRVEPLFKVQWEHRKGFGWTWESYSEMCEYYPDLFATKYFGDKIQFKWGKIVTPNSMKAFMYNYQLISKDLSLDHDVRTCVSRYDRA